MVAATVGPARALAVALAAQKPVLAATDLAKAGASGPKPAQAEAAGEAAALAAALQGEAAGLALALAVATRPAVAATFAGKLLWLPGVSAEAAAGGETEAAERFVGSVAGPAEGTALELVLVTCAEALVLAETLEELQ